MPCTWPLRTADRLLSSQLATLPESSTGKGSEGACQRRGQCCLCWRLLGRLQKAVKCQSLYLRATHGQASHRRSRSITRIGRGKLSHAAPAPPHGASPHGLRGGEASATERPVAQRDALYSLPQLSLWHGSHSPSVLLAADNPSLPGSPLSVLLGDLECLSIWGYLHSMSSAHRLLKGDGLQDWSSRHSVQQRNLHPLPRTHRRCLLLTSPQQLGSKGEISDPLPGGQGRLSSLSA